jgi:hypothetical protein
MPVRIAALVPVGLLAALAFACGPGNGSQAGSWGPAPLSEATNNTPPQPILVKVDPNVTMTAIPGEGVGVFNEYKTGGHWHVWWTCDTTRTAQSCAFDVKVSPASGELTNVTSETFASTDTLASTGSSLEAQTTTSSTAEGVYFDAPPGVPITLDAAVGGLLDGSFLFFVQDGQVNGGFTGQLTDPLMLEGAAP